MFNVVLFTVCLNKLSHRCLYIRPVLAGSILNILLLLIQGGYSYLVSVVFLGLDEGLF